MHYNTLEKFPLHKGKKKLLSEKISIIRRILFCEKNLSKWKQDVDTLQRFLLHKDKKKISFCENINHQKILLFKYWIKSFWRNVNPKNFLLWNKPHKIKTANHYIKKVPSAERQENDFFLWKYEPLECFSFLSMKCFSRGVNKKNFLLSNISFKMKTACW